MQVLHVIHRLSDGGASRSLLTMARTSAAAGHTHRIASLLPPSARARHAARAAGLALLEAPAPGGLHAAAEQADIVQVHFWNTPELYEWLWSDLPPMRLLLRLNVGGGHAPQVLTPALLDFADLVAAGSPYTLALPVCAASPPAARARLALLPPAADFSRLAGHTPRPHPHFTVGYVGTVDFAKLHPRFIALCAAIRIPDAQFVVCGPGGAAPALARQAAAHGLADRLELCGPVEDVGAVFARLDVFGYPLCADNYSSADAVLHEAMFAGLPVVVFAHGGAAHTVAHGHTGMVVRSEAEYVGVIEHLSRLPAVRARLGAAAHAHARRTWGAEACVADLHACYARLLAAPKRRRAWPRPVPAGGAARLIEALGDAHGEPFARSMQAGDPQARLAAEERIAAATPVLASSGGGGILHYRNRYPEDGHLRLWTGLVLERSGSRVRALGEYRAALAHGCDDARVRWYLARAAAGGGAVEFARATLRQVVREAPALAGARALLAELEARHG